MPAMPGDAKELILLASQRNGLVGASLQPWHLKASYKLLDGKGKLTDEGTIEEFWSGHQKRRVTYTGTHFTQTTYWTQAGMYQTGVDELPSELIGTLRSAVVEPIPPRDFLETQTFDIKQSAFGAVTLACVSGRIALPPQADNAARALGPSYCLNKDRPVLKFCNQGLGQNQVLLNRHSSFQSRFVAQDVRIFRPDNSGATLQIDSLETIKTDDSVFIPSPAARLLPPPVSVASAGASGRLIIQATPNFPSIAKSGHTSGTVVIEAVIAKSGKIRMLAVKSGALVLQQAALDAVRQWAYWPFFDDGEPVEVTAKISVVFAITR